MRKLTLIITLLYCNPGAAILLDCTAHGDGTYTCVELKPATGAVNDNSAPATAAGAAAGTAASTSRPATTFMEQARSHCTYEPPRKRINNKGANSARLIEDNKRAQRAYDECLVREAARLRQEAK